MFEYLRELINLNFNASIPPLIHIFLHCLWAYATWLKWTVTKWMTFLCYDSLVVFGWDWENSVCSCELRGQLSTLAQWIRPFLAKAQHHQPSAWYRKVRVIKPKWPIALWDLSLHRPPGLSPVSPCTETELHFGDGFRDLPFTFIHSLNQTSQAVRESKWDVFVLTAIQTNWAD